MSSPAVTMFFGIVLFFVMPASPADTKYFNETERKIAIERIRDNKTGINDKEFKKYQLVEALKDVKLYLFSLGVLAANISNGGEYTSPVSPPYRPTANG